MFGKDQFGLTVEDESSCNGMFLALLSIDSQDLCYLWDDQQQKLVLNLGKYIVLEFKYSQFSGLSIGAVEPLSTIGKI
jgi:hypothetical protein